MDPVGHKNPSNFPDGKTNLQRNHISFGIKLIQLDSKNDKNS